MLELHLRQTDMLIFEKRHYIKKIKPKDNETIMLKQNSCLYRVDDFPKSAAITYIRHKIPSTIQI